METTSQASKTRFYKLTYKRSFSSKPEEIIFEFQGDKAKAILEGRAHCNFMNWKFIDVHTYVVNLDHQRKLKASDPDFDETRYTGDETIKSAAPELAKATK